MPASDGDDNALTDAATAARILRALAIGGEALWELNPARGTFTRLCNSLGVSGARDGDVISIAELQDTAHPEDRDLIRDGISACLAEPGAMIEVSYRARGADDRWVWIMVRGRSLLTNDGELLIIGASRDITTIKDDAERLSLALRSAHEELWEVDLAIDSLHRENVHHELDLPVSVATGASAKLTEFLHPDDRDILVSAFRRAVSGQQHTFSAAYRGRTRDGQYRWLDSQGMAYDMTADGVPTRIIGTTRDITAFKRVEDELRELNDVLELRVADRTADLQRANLALQQSVSELQATQRRMVDAEKMAALGGLVAGVAHEINTPIGVSVTAASHLADVLGAVQKRAAAKSGAVSPELQDALTACDIVLRNLRRADALIRSFKQVATDQTDDQPRRLDLAEYIDEVLLALTPAFKRRDVSVEVLCPKGLLVTTYPGAIYQILSNLLFNSIRHGFPDGQGGSIRIDAGLDGSLCRIDYRDDGVGMSDSVRARIFEPFFTTRRNEGGSGLGMHIAFNLVSQRLRGHIDVESAPGAGARFIIEFPVNVEARP